MHTVRKCSKMAVFNLVVSLLSLTGLHLMVANFCCYGVAINLFVLVLIVDCSLVVAELIFA